MLRFLPLTDHPLHKVDTCIILDIDNDLKPFYKPLIQNLEKDVSKGIVYRSRFCYRIQPRIQCIPSPYVEYPLIASFIFQSGYSFPYIHYSNFFEKTQQTKQEEWIQSCGVDLKHAGYGIDEIFMNGYYIPILQEEKETIKVGALLINHYDLFKTLDDLVLYLLKDMTLHEKEKELIRKVWKFMSIEPEQEIEPNPNKPGKYQLKHEKQLIQQFVHMTPSQKEQWKTLIQQCMNESNQPRVKQYMQCLLHNLSIDIQMINVIFYGKQKTPEWKHYSFR
jgi:hypothetical protein